MNKVKLVIWDLDNTIWGGALGEVGYDNVNPFIDIIKYFKKNTSKGVMNSVCSLSNASPAMTKKLKSLGIYEDIVFPSINTYPKGPRIKDIIKKMQLRPENVLFVDDIETNLEEAKYYSPGLITINSKSAILISIFNRILNDFENDIDLKRLKQYKILETKNELRSSFSCDEQFLYDSNIKISIKKDPYQYMNRIEELINRTNQLNFTKKNFIEEDIKTKNSYVVNVRDKYGDYGICGFISYDEKGTDHFVFSCRVLNMGIETFCFHHLGCPKFEIVGEVSASIEDEKPEWITVEPFKEIKENTNKKDIFLIGGCDLEQIYPFIKDKEKICTFFPYTGWNKKHPVRRDHIDILVSSKLSNEQLNHVLATVPHFDSKAFQLKSYEDFNTIIYSPLIDYLDHTYISKGIEMTLNWEISSVKTANDMKKYYEIKGIPIGKQKIFFDNWKRIEKDYGKKLIEFLNITTGVKTVIILLAATNTYSDLNKEWCEDYKKLNTISKKISEKYHNVVCMDVDKYIKNRNDFTNSVRHYKKHIYLKIADEINTVIGSKNGK